MGAVWSEQRKLDNWLEVELAVVDALAERASRRTTRARSASARRSRSRRSRSARRSPTTTSRRSWTSSPRRWATEGRWVHYGLTSSDVLDTALALQLEQAGVILVAARGAIAMRSCAARASTSTRSASAARTASRPSRRRSASSSPGSRSRPSETAPACGRGRAGVGRARCPARSAPTRRLARARGGGARRLGLAREDVATQVVARDRHAQFLYAIALAGAGLERFATEIRHLQRTEVREVEEPFRAGQKGSSAMPHKRNPIVSERISGIARLLRGYAQVGLENVALWHERDISHSSAERVALPDASSCSTTRALALRVVEGMVVHADRMRANLESGTARSSRSARCSRWSGPACRATTPTGSCRRTRSAHGTRARRSASCSTRLMPASTSTRSSTHARSPARGGDRRGGRDRVDSGIIRRRLRASFVWWIESWM